MKKTFALVNIFLTFLTFSAIAQNRISSEAHIDRVNKIVISDNPEKQVYTAGSDGVLIKWNNELEGEHIQISDNEILLTAVSPSGNEIAVYTTKSGMNNQVSIWNTKTNTQKYSFDFDAPVNSISFSGKGTYLVVTTSTVNGVYFIKTATGQIEQKIKDTVGIIGYTQTGSSEKNIFLYSNLGNVYYYDLINNKIILKAKTESDLQDPRIFKNSYLAAVKKNAVLLIDIRPGKTFGQTACRIQGINPVLSGTDEYIYYSDKLDKENTLYRISLNEKGFTKPEILTTFSSDKEIISTAQKGEKEFYFGGNKGSVFRIKETVTINEETDNVETMLVLTKSKENTTEKILDIDTYENEIYFLTANSIIKTDSERSTIKILPNEYNLTNICVYKEKILLWHNSIHSEIFCYDTDTESLEKIHTTDNHIQKIKKAPLCGEYCFIEVEGSSKVNLIDLSQTKPVSTLFSGIGIQDAVSYGNNSVYIAKTSSSRPQGALLYINTKTKETVPQEIPGNIVYVVELNDQLNVSDLPEITNNTETKISEAGNLDSKSQKFCIYGLMLSDKTSRVTTTLFAFDPIARKYQSLLELNEQDAEALISVDFPRIYTNLGSKEINAVQANGSRKIALKRSAGLPVKVKAVKNCVLLLNKDGSVSLYKTDQTSSTALWTISNSNSIEVYNY